MCWIFYLLFFGLFHILSNAWYHLSRWISFLLFLFPFQFGHWQPWALNQNSQFLILLRWMKLFLPMALLEVSSLTTFGMWKVMFINQWSWTRIFSFSLSLSRFSVGHSVLYGQLHWWPLWACHSPSLLLCWLTW